MTRRSLAIASMAVGVACAHPPRDSGHAAPRLSATALSAADAALLANLLAIADARSPDTTVIEQALAAPAPFVRAYAARTIGQIGVASRAGRLRALTADPDTMIAADAAFALGLLHDSTASPVLATSMARSETVAAAAAWSLGEIGEFGRSSLEQILRTGQPAAAVTAALQATAKLRPVPAALVLPYLAHQDLGVRRSAAYAVTRSRVPAATAAVLQMWEAIRSQPGQEAAGTSPLAIELRTYIARGLTKQLAGDSLGVRMLAALQQLADDPHPHVRTNAVRSLASFGAGARGDLLRHLRDPDANVRIAAVQSLGGVLAAAEDWDAAWRADTGFTFRRYLLGVALRAHVRLAAMDSAAPDAWQRSADWRRRAAAAEASGAGSTADVDAIAVPLLADRDARVRAAAFRTASAWSDSATAVGKPYARLGLGGFLADSDVFVRATILDALRPRARADDALIGLREWRRAAGDLDNDARIAALRLVVAAWRADSTSFGVFRDSLAAVDPPNDPLEREVGRTIAPWSKWPGRTGVARPTSWYVKQVHDVIAPALAGRVVRARITTQRGAIEVALGAADAPLTVVNFAELARRHYFDGLAFHRVVPNFVAQDGDPRGDGSGGPGYAIRDELNRHWYDRGAVGMALSGPDTGGSQYFLTHSPQPHLDGHYTVFGHILSGYDALDQLVQGDRITSIVVR